MTLWNLEDTLRQQVELVGWEDLDFERLLSSRFLRREKETLIVQDQGSTFNTRVSAVMKSVDDGY